MRGVFMGRNPGVEARQYQIQTLWDVHHEILRRLVLGQKSVEIARDLQVTAAVVSYVKNSEVGKKQLSLMHAASDVSVVNIAGRIKELAVQAVAVMEAALDSEQPMQTRLKAAVDVLDRAGHSAPKVMRTENYHAHFGAEDIEAIKLRARESGVVVDVIAEEC
jgi:hypothetical protein